MNSFEYYFSPRRMNVGSNNNNKEADKYIQI
jgi:hypothetical protein